MDLSGRTEINIGDKFKMNLATVLHNRRALLESARLYQCAVSHVLSGILLKNDLSDAKCTTSVDPLSIDITIKIFKAPFLLVAVFSHDDSAWGGDITKGGRSALAYSVMNQIIDALNCDLG